MIRIPKHIFVQKSKRLKEKKKKKFLIIQSKVYHIFKKISL